MEHTLKIDFKNYLKTKKIIQYYYDNPLWLYEAISNAYYSILEKNCKDGKIIIDFYSKSSAQLNIDGKVDINLDKVVISDNGAGLNKDRFEAFNTLNTGFNSAKGGKGSGRITYSLYFGNIKIFSLNKGYEITNESWLKEITYEENPHAFSIIFTKFLLKNSKIAKNIRDIGENIIYHFLPFYEKGDFPIIELNDIENKERINLNELYPEIISAKMEKLDFEIDGYEFTLYFLKMNSHKFKNSIFLCSNSRIVQEFNIRKMSFNINSDNPFFIYVISDYLEERCNQFRDEIEFDKSNDTNQSDLGLDTSNTRIKLEEKILEIIKEKYSDTYNQVLQNKILKINNIINSTPMLKKFKNCFSNEEIKEFAENLDVKKVEKDKILTPILKFIIKRTEEIENEIKEAKSIKEINNKMDNLSKIGKSKAIDFFEHRLKTIELYKKFYDNWERNANNKEESEIHEFFIKKCAEGDINEYPNNLWMINENFSYNKIFKSDLKISKECKKRPDVWLSELGDNELLNNIKKPKISIVEFKNIYRTEFGKKPPFTQVEEYGDYILKEFLKGEMVADNNHLIESLFKDRKDHFFEFFCINEINEKFSKELMDNNFICEQNSQLYWKIDKSKNAIYKVVSYSKIFDDAKTKYNNIIKMINDWKK